MANYRDLFRSSKPSIWESLASTVGQIAQPQVSQVPSGLGSLAQIEYLKAAQPSGWQTGISAGLQGLGYGMGLTRQRQQQNILANLVSDPTFMQNLKLQSFNPITGEMSYGIEDKMQQIKDLDTILSMAGKLGISPEQIIGGTQSTGTTQLPEIPTFDIESPEVTYTGKIGKTKLGEKPGALRAETMTKTGYGGTTTYKYKPSPEEEAKEAEIKIGQEVKKQVEAQKGKEQLKVKQDVLNVQGKTLNTFDSWLDTVNDTYEKTGIAPGPIGGIVTTVRGITKANPYYEGFKGGLIEYASAVGRVSMPGSRATRLITLFKSTAPGTYSSIQSAVQTAADSWRNAISTDISRHPEEYKNDINNAGGLADYLQQEEDIFREGLIERIKKRHPDLLNTTSMGGQNKTSSLLNDIEQELRRRSK